MPFEHNFSNGMHLLDIHKRSLHFGTKFLANKAMGLPSYMRTSPIPPVEVPISITMSLKNQGDPKEKTGLAP